MTTPILSEYQNGTKNARVYKTETGEFGVLLFEATDDYNEFRSYPSFDEADGESAKWVKQR
jgi:hypothetical protein